ncbi:unnamed protein product [Rotaria sordida]|uniref:Uncharacterized protein n=1 Tax=Rotaria sordida TaxID=392033 RepID=A0A819JKF1_9BILA|nr:unnamed protein product [Rotaria sordida]
MYKCSSRNLNQVIGFMNIFPFEIDFDQYEIDNSSLFIDIKLSKNFIQWKHSRKKYINLHMKSKTKFNQCQFQLRINDCSLSKFQNYTIINQYCEINYESMKHIRRIINISNDINQALFPLAINSTIEVFNSTEKYINYAIILLISSILLSILAWIFVSCIEQCRKRKSDVIRSPSATDISSENITSHTNTTLLM